MCGFEFKDFKKIYSFCLTFNLYGIIIRLNINLFLNLFIEKDMKNVSYLLFRYINCFKILIYPKKFNLDTLSFLNFLVYFMYLRIIYYTYIRTYINI